MLDSTHRLRSDLDVLSTDAIRRMQLVLRGQTDADVAKQQLTQVLKPIVKIYGSAGLAVSTDWYDTTRRSAGVKGKFRAVAAPDDGEDDGVEELVAWGLTPVYSAEPDWATAGVLLAGGLQRRVLAPARDSTRLSSIKDPQSKGWKRDGVGKCDYCRERIDSGVVFRDGDLACHDRCGCQAVPAWGV